MGLPPLCSHLGYTGSPTPMLMVLEDVWVFPCFGFGGVPGEARAGGRSWCGGTLVRWPAQASVQLQFETLRPPFQSKYEQVQKSLGEVEKQLEEAQQKIQLNDLERNHTGGGGGEPPGLMGLAASRESCPFVSLIIHSFIHSHILSAYDVLDTALGAELLAEKTQSFLLGAFNLVEEAALNM